MPLFDEYFYVIFHRRCGSHISAAKKASMEREFSGQRKLPSKDALVYPVIDVNFNIIAANNTVARGWIRYVGFPFSRTLFHLMLVFQSFTGIESILDRDFKASGIQFRLMNTTRILNNNWFTSFLSKPALFLLLSI
jgi:hypothetical protein